MINTGVATSLYSLATLILYAIGPSTMLFLTLFKLFLNAMLAMLNARESLRSRMGEDMGLRLPLRFVSSSRVEVPRELTLAHEEVPSSRSSPARTGL
ncbi:hypothetical protein C8Q76DRAFT_21015 [Earliella scabrosa]|nr:hypothetical protein C8Q76DRAFT_21015 [Earliella scabrosa]